MARQSPIPETLEELIDVLEVEVDRRRRDDRTLKLAVGILVALYMAMIVAVWIRNGSFPSDLASSFASFAGLGGIGAAASARHKQALSVAAKFDDPRLIPFLIDAATISQPRVPSLAREILTARLPSVAAAGDLPEESKRQLASTLVTTREVSYLRVALDTLQRVGGSESISSLEAFSKRQSKKGGKEFEKLQDRSRIILGEVRIRAAKALIQAKEAETSEILSKLLVENLQSERPSTGRIVDSANTSEPSLQVGDNGL